MDDFLDDLLDYLAQQISYDLGQQISDYFGLQSTAWGCLLVGLIVCALRFFFVTLGHATAPQAIHNRTLKSVYDKPQSGHDNPPSVHDNPPHRRHYCARQHVPDPVLVGHAVVQRHAVVQSFRSGRSTSARAYGATMPGGIRRRHDREADDVSVAPALNPTFTLLLPVVLPEPVPALYPI
jgi:hypothetical protein